ncbi:uncharacterized protein LOC131927656 [Physella acuta]|uniref:uncharacterized protein LOC131927656 n=1 Tax=Physella acuta TaxID=109671 RepID=UPI0027DB7DB1|nr:uncharacterized protein LOC131927656 [Physella acuta]
MSNTQENSEALALSGWTVVDNQGEILSGDVDSESSESSIEVVHCEGDETVSYHLKNRDLQSGELKLLDHGSDDLHYTSSNDEKLHDILNISCSSNQEQEEEYIAELSRQEDTHLEVQSSLCDAVNNSSEEVGIPTSAGSFGTPGPCVSEVNEEFPLQQGDPAGCSEEPGGSEFHSPLPTPDAEAVAGNDGEVVESMGACCLELLTQRQPSDLVDSSSTEEKASSPCSVTFEDTGIVMSPVSDLTGSDTDSDFVRLDSEEDSENVQPPASSIAPSFSFMRASVYEQHRFDNAEEEDQDDDTESSNEEGVDDRIESEQSETGSLSAHNDVGDLSVFADIGDLPLEAGPRNYIHCPNNHLSTILNIIVVLAAILTMGISLGIIMATDLEIEEWQTAYEVQSIKVYQLQSQIKELQKGERKLQELNSIMDKLKLQVGSYDTALHILATDGEEDGKSSGDGFSMIRKVITDFVVCEELSQVMRYHCYLKLRPFIESYSIMKIEEQQQHKPTYASTTYDTLVDLDKVTQDDRLVQDSQDIEKPVSEGHSAADFLQKSRAALPIPLDIKQLQQSLTREQERALRWQQLYLLERRQKERERDNEELEDERDREQWESEKEHAEHVECIKRLLSTNITTLTQHIAKWNVSVFDDFANLSLLLSGVAELKQSVFDSVHKVWEGAEDLINNLQKNTLEKSPLKSLQETVPNKTMIMDYINVILNDIRRGSDKDTLVDYLQEKLIILKRSIDRMSHSDPIHTAWKRVEEILLQFAKVTFDTQKWGDVALDKDTLVMYVTDIMEDFKQLLAADFNLNGEDVLESIVNEDEHYPFDNIDRSYHFSHKASMPHEPTPPYSRDKKDGYWPRRLGKLLKKTGASVGRKVANTWHKIKNIWHEKKPSLVRMVESLGHNVIQVSSKLTKLCTDLPKSLLSKGKIELDIHSKCVSKVRKMYQQQLLQNPCRTLGKFSAECNADKKQVKKMIKTINSEFSRLLKVTPIYLENVRKMKQRKLEILQRNFKDFYNVNANSKLLLKSDLEWVKCQNQWLSTAFQHKMNPKYHVEENKCDSIKPEVAFEAHCHTQAEQEDKREGNSAQQHFVNKKDGSSFMGQTSFANGKDGGDNPDIQGDATRANTHITLRYLSDFETSFKEINMDSGDSLENNNTNAEEENWLLERARYRLNARKERERAEWIFNKASDRELQRRLDSRQYEKSQWYFNRRAKTFACDKADKHCDKSYILEEEHGPSENWYTRQAYERQKVREEEKLSDWYFERAAERRKHHKTF